MYRVQSGDLANGHVQVGRQAAYRVGQSESVHFFGFTDGHTPLMGVMFTDLSGTTPCPGGAATRWHVHPNLCWNSTTNGTEAATATGCPGATVSLARLEMLHVWVFNDPSGPFAADLTKADYQAAMAQLN